MNRTLLVDDEMLDRIIINELKEVYRLNRLPEKIDCSDDYIESDTELLHSVDRVLRYFMTRDEYDKWVAE
jgi:hypothetical protein